LDSRSSAEDDFYFIHMLTKQQKQELVKDLTDKFSKQKSVVFTDYTDTKVNDLQVLRRDLKKGGVDYQVAKKTLMQIAVKNAGINDIDIIKMPGQIGVGFGFEDEVSAAKILAEFSKKNKTLKILGGLLGANYLEATRVQALAQLPNLDGMRAQFVGVLAGPVRNFVSVLNANLRNFVGVLDQIKNTK